MPTLVQQQRDFLWTSAAAPPFYGRRDSIQQPKRAYLKSPLDVWLPATTAGLFVSQLPSPLSLFSNINTLENVLMQL
ncbi:hypothetical protein OEZ85_000144 [Tetradesmus obliquus]|uniref:Uncharacterized protein n=1 Tax=Tetradesmus obliquus TaxID=3088 RepID=A0ABY8UPP9_TETOB|nr:hypothetical protein OEZ85_000144 [Tetradesmus obliquus]